MVSNPKPFIVLDHDGTLTDLEQDFAQYLSLAKKYLSRHLNTPHLSSRIDSCLARVLAHPEDHGWRVEGRVVAPASDQYLLLHEVVEMLSPGSEELKTNLFHTCYLRITTTYKPGVAELLRKLARTYQVCIVTNSLPEQVRNKLATILTPSELTAIKLVGKAQKMAIDLSWLGVVPPGAYHGLANFPARGIYLQRKAYYEALFNLCRGDLASLIVVGDIGEMDLALPDYLGASTILVPSSLTPSWELAYWTDDNTRKRMVANNLHQLAKYLL